jgi:glutamyl-tRNA(Gln) amidotransferase subunit E
MHDILANRDEWKRLKFSCGLEIHHQIFTEKKLFCHCPAGLYSDVYHAEVQRHMRPTLSELGEYDCTALMEFKTKKEIIYRLNRDSVCTYEMDDNPPFLINEQAIDIALTIALAFKCKIVGELHIIRKQYLDGSIPAGFQRTTIVGVDGEFPLSNGKIVKVIQLGLEEDSCREIMDDGHKIFFMADRLSMPLIEVVTENTLETPEEAAEATERIGRMLRATQMVRRGSGAGRQDVNISIEGTPRVEIKGVPRFPRIPELTAFEAKRQEALLLLRSELHSRGFKAGDIPGEAVIWNDSETKFRRPELAAAHLTKDTIRIVKLENMKGIAIWPTVITRTFADEISGRIRVIACLDQMPNILHSDGEAGGLDDHDKELVMKATKASDKDLIMVVWGSEEDTDTAVKEIQIRFAEALVGIPSETRQALANNSNDFERLLPGPDRMYPDTDSPPHALSPERIEEAKKRVPIAPWIREEIYCVHGLPEDVIYRLAISPLAELYDSVVETDLIKPQLAGEVLTRRLIHLRRKRVNVDLLSEKHLHLILHSLGKGLIFREGLDKLMIAWIESPELTFDQLLEKLGWVKADEKMIQTTIDFAIEKAKSMNPRAEENVLPLAMGIAMRQLEGRASGKVVFEKIEAAIA